MQELEGGARDMIARLERLLSALVEGTVERILVRQVQPVQIARRLETAMEQQALAGVDGLMAPNDYAVRLDPTTYDRFVGVRARLEDDLARHLAGAAASRRLRPLQPIVVRLHRDEALPARTLDVAATFREEAAAVPGQPAAERTMVMPVTATRPGIRPALLQVEGPGGLARTVELRDDACSIGRAADNDLVLTEPAISRHHAAIHRDGGRFYIEDSGSVNGVLVNGKRVQRARLRDGDRLLIGTTPIVFRQL
jgi:hypothetical protein